MKKYLALLLALTLLFTLASCRKEDKGTTTKEEKTSEEERGDKSSSDTNNGPGSAPGVANADSSDMTGALSYMMMVVSKLRRRNSKIVRTPSI